MEVSYRSELLKEEPWFPRYFLPNCSGKETVIKRY